MLSPLIFPILIEIVVKDHKCIPLPALRKCNTVHPSGFGREDSPGMAQFR